jgi:hypothetical protein
MAAPHFAALVDQYRNGRSDRRIAADGGLNLNWLTYPLRPGTIIRVMPDDARIALLARAIGASAAEVRTAFEQDVHGETPYATLRGQEGQEQDPQMQQLVRLAGGLDTHHRGTLVAMARSLATLQRRTTTPAIETHDTREVG